MQRMVDMDVTLRLPGGTDLSSNEYQHCELSSHIFQSTASPCQEGTSTFLLGRDASKRNPLFHVLAASRDPFPLLLVKQMTTHLVGSPSYSVGQ